MICPVCAAITTIFSAFSSPCAMPSAIFMANGKALMEECLHDVEQAVYHPHKALNRAIAQHLMQGDLQENLDSLKEDLP